MAKREKEGREVKEDKEEGEEEEEEVIEEVEGEEEEMVMEENQNMLINKLDSNLTTRRNLSKECLKKNKVKYQINSGQYTKKQANDIGQGLGNFRSKPLEERRKEMDEK